MTSRNLDIPFNSDEVLICYHRADLDGHCSGALMKQRYPNADMLGMDYGDEFDVYTFKNKYVIMVDFSLQPFSNMLEVLDACRGFLWIDHHRTAIDEFKQLDEISFKWGFLLDEKFSACELCWIYNNPEKSEKEMPDYVRLLGRYDIWDLAADERILPFQYGMRIISTDPRSDISIWNALELDSVDKQYLEHKIREGRVILLYQDQQNRGLMRTSFDVRFEGLNFLAVNASGINSMAFNGAFDPNKHDAVIRFHLSRGKKWKFSMYSPDQSIDLSGIAKKMGGGGHPFACGFEAKELPFENEN